MSASTPSHPDAASRRVDEQAAAVLFLASDAASFLNGQTLIVDGGELSGRWWNDDDGPPLPDHIDGLPDLPSDAR